MRSSTARPFNHGTISPVWFSVTSGISAEVRRPFAGDAAVLSADILHNLSEWRSATLTVHLFVSGSSNHTVEKL